MRIPLPCTGASRRWKVGPLGEARKASVTLQKQLDFSLGK